MIKHIHRVLPKLSHVGKTFLKVNNIFSYMKESKIRQCQFGNSKKNLNSVPFFFKLQVLRMFEEQLCNIQVFETNDLSYTLAS